jgi:transcriptional antiterminator NusG
MASAWYVLQVNSGYENRIEKVIRQKIEDNTLNKEIVRDTKVPSEQIVEVKDGKKRSQTKKFFPGYVLVELDLPQLGWTQTCTELKGIEGVKGFVGYLSNNRPPRPLNAEEVRAIMQKAGEIKGEKPVRARQTFHVGELIKITDGPFESFTGTIEEVNSEKNKLKVMVGIFGRNTPVEVDILQVEKVT